MFLGNTPLRSGAAALSFEANSEPRLFRQPRFLLFLCCLLLVGQRLTLGVGSGASLHSFPITEDGRSLSGAGGRGSRKQRGGWMRPDSGLVHTTSHRGWDRLRKGADRQGKHLRQGLGPSLLFHFRGIEKHEPMGWMRMHFFFPFSVSCTIYQSSGSQNRR